MNFEFNQSRSFERNEVAIREANKYYAVESGFALTLAFVINLFVTSVSAKSFYGTPEAQNITLFNTVRQQTSYDFLFKSLPDLKII
jgi:Mn2+/Fe2+ NRAMP family transporter